MKQKRFAAFFCFLLLALVVTAFPAWAKRKPVVTLDSFETSEDTYNPWYGQKLKITSLLTGNAKVKKNDRFSLTLVIRNEEGKKVYKTTKTIKGKTIRAKGGVLKTTIKWDGKTNTSKKKKLVAEGTYTLTATLKCTRAQNAKKPKKVTASCSLSVEKSTPYYDPVTGTVIPRYTGTAEIDYIAEQMLQEAGVKLDMPEEMRVRLIYNFLTVNFKHLQETGNITPYYNLTALAGEIAAFKAETKKKAAAGLITYSNKWSGELNHFNKRAGTCNNNAAAFVILCNHAGIQCKRIWGQVRNGSSWMNHYWNSAVVDGVTWYYDIDVEIHHYNGSGVSAFTQYRKTLEQSKKSHQYV